MSTLLIACCYWKQANNWGAGAAIVVGALVPISRLVCEKLPADSWPGVADFAKTYEYPWGIAGFIACAAAMIFGSLLKVVLHGTRD